MYKLVLAKAIETYLHESFEQLNERVESEYEMEGNLTEVAHEAYDGFIPFTNGGYDLITPVDLSYVVGSGRYPGNAKVKKQINDAVAYSYEMALESFCENEADQLRKLFTMEELSNPNTDTINYHELYERGEGELAERLSETESESLYEGGTFFLQYRVLYFSADNHRNESGEDELYFMSGVNLDFEYGRDKGLETMYERNVKVSELTPEVIKEVMKAMFEAV